MFCANCGKEIENGSTSCSSCGWTDTSVTSDTNDESLNDNFNQSGSIEVTGLKANINVIENIIKYRKYIFGVLAVIACCIIAAFYFDLSNLNIDRRHGEFKYQNDGSDGIRITGYTGKGGLVTIPSMIKEKPITSIGNEAFMDKKLTGVIIPNSVIAIGNISFSNNQINNIIIPDSVIAIGDEAFRSNRLISITLGDSITSIGISVFSFNQLSNINIPDSVKSIGINAFFDNQLVSVNIGSNVILENNAIGSGFEDVYNRSNKLAGTYTRDNTRSTNWSAASVNISSGDEYFNNKDYYNAISEYTTAIQFEPNNDYPYFQRARAYLILQDYDRSITDNTQVIRLNPNNSSAYFNIAISYWNKNDFQQAIFNMTQSIRLNPNDAGAYAARGGFYINIRDFTRAIADFETALRLDPNNSYYRESLDYVRQRR